VSTPAAPLRPSLPSRIVAILSGYGLASVLLALLLLITFLGTLEQAEYGLVASQKRYFESLFVDRIDLGACWRALALDAYLPIGNLTLPAFLLPGGYALMAALFVNMFLGGIVRIRKSPRTIGVVISHFAILFMIAAGAVAHHFGTEGILHLREGQTNNEFVSFHDRVIEIEKVQADPKAKRSALVIDGALYQDLAPGKARTFTHESLPFDLTLTHWLRHARPVRLGPEASGEKVDGFGLQKLPHLNASGAAMPDEQLLNACIATARDKKTGAEQKGILWEMAAAPWTVTFGGEKYVIDLARRSYRMPFAVRLDRTEREEHPGTSRARRFTSWVTKISGTQEEKRVITMNEPMRGGGYAVFQQTFDDGVESRSGVKSSGFQIVRNPSDHWPLIACVVVAEGLLLHFLMMLARFLKLPAWTFALSLILAFNAAFAVAIWKLL
jgi:hypothetical protein